MNRLDLQDIKSVFCDTLRDVIAVVSGISLEEASTEDDILLDDIVSTISLNGMEHGQLLVYADRHTLKHLTCCMTGAGEATVSDDDLFDTIGELTNMIAGNAKTRFSDATFSYIISSPFVISGENIRIILKKSVTRISCGFNGHGIKIGLKIIY